MSWLPFCKQQQAPEESVIPYNNPFHSAPAARSLLLAAARGGGSVLGSCSGSCPHSREEAGLCSHAGMHGSCTVHVHCVQPHSPVQQLLLQGEGCRSVKYRTGTATQNLKRQIRWKESLFLFIGHQSIWEYGILGSETNLHRYFPNRVSVGAFLYQSQTSWIFKTNQKQQPHTCRKGFFPPNI